MRKDAASPAITAAFCTTGSARAVRTPTATTARTKQASARSAIRDTTKQSVGQWSACLAVLLGARYVHLHLAVLVVWKATA